MMPVATQLHASPPSVTLRPAARLLRTIKASMPVTLAATPLNVVVDFSLERCDQQPPRSPTSDLVRHKNSSPASPSSRLSTTPSVSVASPLQRGYHETVLLTRNATLPFSCAHQIHAFR